MKKKLLARLPVVLQHLGDLGLREKKHEAKQEEGEENSGEARKDQGDRVAEKLESLAFAQGDAAKLTDPSQSLQPQISTD